jgi:cell cycle arrest protein BUB2
MAQQPLRRVRKFPSSSILENNFNDPIPTTSTVATPNTTNTITSTTANIPRISASTNARLSTNAPQVKHHLPTSRSSAKHLRSRSQSQANLDMPAHTPHHIHSASQPSALQRYTRKAASTAQLSQHQASTIEGLISKPPASLTEALQDLRYLILTQGVAADTDGNVCLSESKLPHALTPTQSALRIYIWSILLGVAPMRTNEYVTLVRRGASSSYSKIRNDTFRTLATDPLFRRRVSESSIIRLLNAFQWKMKDTGEDAQYVQGMNVIAAPFLYAARSEVEAFSLFAVFIQRECPGYVRPTMEGVHSGLKLVDQVLETVDPKLFAHLQSKFLTAELYAFPCTLSPTLVHYSTPAMLIVYSGPNTLGMHTAAARGVEAMGLPPSLRGTLEYPLRSGTATADAR